MGTPTSDLRLPPCHLGRNRPTDLLFDARPLSYPHTANLLSPVKDACQEAAGVELVLHIKAKGDDGGAAIDAMLEAAKVSQETTIRCWLRSGRASPGRYGSNSTCRSCVAVRAQLW